MLQVGLLVGISRAPVFECCCGMIKEHAWSMALLRFHGAAVGGPVDGRAGGSQAGISGAECHASFH